ncbi:MAG: lysoplasmalogenase [Burkholderiaceae bacterium]
MGVVIALGAGAAGAAGLMIAGLYRPLTARWLVYVFKPLATILILVLALFGMVVEPSRYAIAVVVGLVFSLAGDVFLMLPSDRFREGLASFLLAHIAYLVAFTVAVGWASPAWPYLAWAVLAVPLVSRLWPGVPRQLRPAVGVYMLVLLAMAAQAMSRALALGDAAAWLAAAGAVLFVVSDYSLALDRFTRRFVAAPALVHVTYYAAQWLIALSIGFAAA